MRIQLANKAPHIKKLAKILKQRFSGQYGVKTFGLVNKSVFITESTLVGAEISVYKNEILVDSHSSFERISWVLGHITGFILFFLPFIIKEGAASQSRYKALELEIGSFLKRRFN